MDCYGKCGNSWETDERNLESSFHCRVCELDLLALVVDSEVSVLGWERLLHSTLIRMLKLFKADFQDVGVTRVSGVK